MTPFMSVKSDLVQLCTGITHEIVNTMALAGETMVAYSKGESRQDPSHERGCRFALALAAISSGSTQYSCCHRCFSLPK
jgi:hypothetical protein